LVRGVAAGLVRGIAAGGSTPPSRQAAGVAVRGGAAPASPPQIAALGAHSHRRRPCGIGAWAER